MKIEIINQQGIKRINLKSLRKKLINAGAVREPPLQGLSGKKISVLLCDNKFIRKLNKRYFKRPSAADVIAFPLGDELNPDYLGEVVVSVEQAIKVSGKLKISWQEELLRYLIHGILHLSGYKDSSPRLRKIMEKKQEEILNKIINENR